eukprot:XP_011670225.1 PREDICTED: fibropellin-3-like [Strongylocentrotus purpuratus]
MPCLYGGSCIIGLDSFSCMCQSGFTGSMCEEAINECTSNPCLNGGTCIDGRALFICLCSNEYNGTRCEGLAINECTSNPCLNGGTCIDGSASFICLCSSGFIGTRCEELDVEEGDAVTTPASTTAQGSILTYSFQLAVSALWLVVFINKVILA